MSNEDVGPWTVVIKAEYHIDGPCTSHDAVRHATADLTDQPLDHDIQHQMVHRLKRTSDVYPTMSEPFDDDSYFERVED